LRDDKREVRGFVRDQRGLATIEWVMIAAVVLVAALWISGRIMTGASVLGNSVANQMEAAS
jgi:Flp pilus assembly pilin Flp